MMASKISPSFLAALVLFVAPATVALTSYPPYYEDESWVYLAPLEALRGNGFSWAAFHEGRASALVFNAATFPFLRVSPFPAETTVRLVSLLFGLAAAIAVLIAARAFAGSSAVVAPVLLMLTPMWFLTARYGRADMLAIALAVGSVAAAASRLPLAAGALSGLAMSVHPVFVWIGPLCALIVFDRCGLRSVGRYVIGGVLGAIPQLAWIAAHSRDYQSIVARYYVTSGVGKGWTSSVLKEWARYRAYAAQITGVEAATQVVGFVALPAIAIIRASRRERLSLIAIAFVPLLGLAMLVGGKNPYYFIYTFPFLAILSAAAVRNAPSRLIEIACLAVLCLAAIHYAPQVRIASKAATVTQMVESVSPRLPHNAVVLSPLIYGGLIRRRPDLTLFTYHALSVRNRWGLPSCEEIPSAIQSLIAQDPRPSSVQRNPDRIFFLSFPDPLSYLRLIYVEAMPADVTCIVGRAAPEVVHVCGSEGGNCIDSLLFERGLNPIRSVAEHD
jgi:hypothetical protein